MLKKLRFIFLILSLCTFEGIHAQLFTRIDQIAGFEGVSENNGVAVADFDNDLDLDIFIVAKGKENGEFKTVSRLFKNNNDGSFTDVTESAGLTNLLTEDNPTGKSGGLDGYKYGVSWGDFNNDGFQDILFTHASKVQLFKNNQDGTFTDITVASGINISNTCMNTGATWFDFNKDGLLDLFVSDWGGCGTNSLYKNLGNETFKKVLLSQPLDSDGDPLLSFIMNPYDFNADGFLDMYISTDHNESNLLYINNKNESFTESVAAYELESYLDDMAVAYNDFDLDGDFDIFLSGISTNNLFENDGTNSFSEVAVDYSIKNTEWTWGSTFADFDLDGDEDIFIANGFVFEQHANVYFENTISEGIKGFQFAQEEIEGLDLTSSIEVLSFDFDNDGDLDVFVTNIFQQSYFYENTSIKGDSSSKNWFKLSLQGNQSNRNGYGAIVTVKTPSANYIRNYTGVGFLSQSTQPVHFGLNQYEIIEELKIQWPSGLVDVYNNINSNQFMLAIEDQELQVLDIAPSEKIKGCTDPNSCNYNPAATEDDGSCAYLEAGEISGPSSSGIHSVETYSYGSQANSTLLWSVEGGKIISGQGTDQIQVEWGFYSEGKVRVIEQGSECSSNWVEMVVTLSIIPTLEHYSVARLWNEALLEAIRHDFARPNVHARNLYHTAVAMYDVFAIYDAQARPFLVGNKERGTYSGFSDEAFIGKEKTEIEEALSYAVYRLLTHRFQNSPGAEASLKRFNQIMEQLEFDVNNTNSNYKTGTPASLGNYVAEQIIAYGLTDGSNELGDYENLFYEPINEPLSLFGNESATNISDPNRWQPLTFETFVDQSGNTIEGDTPEFLGPEWGQVTPFALSESEHSIFQRGSHSYEVYHDPGSPPQLDVGSSDSEHYMWNFSLVSIWSSHLDPTDGVLWDISPNSIGNLDIRQFSNDFKDLPSYYKEIDGGDYSTGHAVNPKTQSPYEPQMVPRGDYSRVLAEFWADGPDSETPPGHWFAILNHVMDHEAFVRKFEGAGVELDDLEWDVKAYFILGGAMHDAAIAAWGIKGWYDYIRPISAIRYMAELGQSTDENLDNYHPLGIPLKEGFVEVVAENDPLRGNSNEHVGKIKVYAWKGHDYISDAKEDVAGVDWILAENWWPYQRPSFVTPPFAGYVSGHSTFSRAAAEVLTLITGDPFFPGGMGEFIAKKNEFLVFEKGPSVDVKLQWATYRDASDQTSLSRIWGGIHPPADDIPGRLIGEKVGVDAFNFALPYFKSEEVIDLQTEEIIVYPNPVEGNEVYIIGEVDHNDLQLFDMLGKSIHIKSTQLADKIHLQLPPNLNAGVYILKLSNTSKLVLVK